MRKFFERVKNFFSGDYRQPGDPAPYESQPFKPIPPTATATSPDPQSVAEVQANIKRRIHEAMAMQPKHLTPVHPAAMDATPVIHADGNVSQAAEETSPKIAVAETTVVGELTGVNTPPAKEAEVLDTVTGRSKSKAPKRASKNTSATNRATGAILKAEEKAVRKSRSTSDHMQSQINQEKAGRGKPRKSK